MLWKLILVYAVGFVGSSFGTLVGGAGLIVVPTLIFLGLPSQMAIATSQFGGSGSAIFGLYEFHRKKLVNVKLGLFLGITAVIGSFLGANLVLRVNPSILRIFIAVATLLILLVFIINPKIGVQKMPKKPNRFRYITGLFFAFFIGIYGGFYGVSLGTFMSYLLILGFGQTFLESAATRKIIGLLLILVALSVFIAHKVVDYSLGITLFLGSGTGSYLGAHFSDRIGNVWIKRLFFVIVCIMAIKLIV